MLRAFDPRVGNLVPCDTKTDAAWIHAHDPSRAEIEEIASRLGVSTQLFERALDVDEVARVSKEENGLLFMVLRVPWVCGEEGAGDLRSATFGVFVAKDRVLTMSRNDVDVVDGLVAQAGELERGTEFAIAVVHVAAQRFLHHLRGVEERVDRLEVKIESDLTNKTIVALLLQNKNLIHLDAALEADKIVLGELREIMPKSAHEDLEDATSELRQAIAVARVERESLAQTMSAFGSIVSNNLNDAMKFLTSLTIILMVPTIVAGFWGMNVGLPLEDNAVAFWYLVAATAIACAATTVVLRLRNWI